MKLKYFLSLCYLNALFQLNAQFRNMDFKQAEDLTKRTVLIELFDESSDDARKANESIRNYLCRNLNIGKEVLCRSTSEMIELLKAGEKDYAILLHQLSSDAVTGVTRYKDREGNRARINDFYAIKYESVMAELVHYDLRLYIVSKESGIGGAVTEIAFAHYLLRPEDYVFAAHQFNRLYDAALQKKTPREYYNPETALTALATKTLLIDPENISFKPEKAKGYSNPHRFVHYKMIQDAIFEKEPGIVYPLMIWSIQHLSYLWVCVDAETGEIYSQVAHGGVNFKKFGRAEPPAKMKRIILNYFDSKFANKVNNRYK